MSEYIERETVIAEAAIEEYLTADGEEVYHEYVPLSVIKSLTAADVRPVVRCRDCKHYEIDNGWCEYFNVDRVFGDYCSEGEKREES